MWPVATFARLRSKYPTSLWARRARFAAGIALAKKGDFHAAEVIYRAEAEALLSAERKQEFADIYLAYADACFEPTEAETKPDYAKALRFYDRALDAGPSPKRRLDVELRAGRCLQLLRNPLVAIKRYEQFVDAHPDSVQCIEARFRLGECYLATGDPKTARRVWQDLLAANAKATSKWIAEATFDLSRTWGVPNPKSDQRMQLGVTALKDFLVRFPTHKRAGQAYLDMAKCYVARGHYEDAVRQLQMLLADKRYKDCEQIPRARQMLGQAFFSQRRFSDALATWRVFLAKHPSDAAWSDIQRRVVDAEYTIATGKVETHQFDEARRLLGVFLGKYPLDKRGPKILFLFGQMNHDEKKWAAAIDDWRRVVSKFPKSAEASHAQYEIAVVMEQDLGKLAEALDEYRKVTSGDYSQRAAQAVARLTSKSMSVVTERVFRSNEKPRLKLTTRNIESVTVRVYNVSMESYFRKMHVAAYVEKLDIALIDPDTKFEFKLPKYQKYEQLENDVEIPLPSSVACGSMAVTVSSKTLEATTLVLQSDLDVIVKASRKEVFVFAENMLAGKPWPDVRLLVSDGRRVFAEATTGRDGVFHATYEQLGDAADVRVLAIASRHVASNVVGLKGIGVAQGLTDKGYIYTDRPAYRAGQPVHVRGCIRQARDGLYVVDKDRHFDLDVVDPRGRLIWQQDVLLDEFGAFHTSFLLPATSPQGQYRLHVHDSAKRQYHGTFRVEQYKSEPVYLSVDVPRRVYCRGETIEGTLRARYYHGAPLAGRELTYQLADDRQHVAKTDEKGEVHFSLPTREFYEEQVLTLVATIPERNVQRRFRFQLATQGFSVQVRAVRDVFVAGETFELTLVTKDVAGKPLAKDLNLRVMELETVGGKVGERLVEEHAVRTAAADGVVRQTLKLDKGGRYRLRAEGDDRWGNPVSGQIDVLVSGDQDRVRLRILTDRQTYKVGDTADVTLHWREKPALALVAFQADRVLDYRVVQLKTGTNKLPIAMDVKLAPNFELDVAVMVDARPPSGKANADSRQTQAARPLRFHTASCPLTVMRDLKVALSYRPANGTNSSVKPGQAMEVTVTTTDPQGKPVTAAVSLGMVEQALLDRFDWQLPSIDRFFRADRCVARFRSHSSIDFTYRPTTTFINPLLLAEKDRIEVARQQLAGRGTLFADDAQMSEPTERPLGGMGGGFFGGPAEPPSTPKNESNDKPDVPDARVQRGVNVDDPFRDSTATAGGAGKPSLRIRQTQRVVGEHEEAARPLKPNRLFQQPDETAYWNPSIVTDKTGLAKVVVRVPPQPTAWRLIAKGITTDTLAGEKAADLVVTKKLFGQLKLPVAIVRGDLVEVIASVHNDRIAEGSMSVTLTTTIAGRTMTQTRQIKIASKGIIEVPFKVTADIPESPATKNGIAVTSETDVTFRLVLAAGNERDLVERTVPLKPYGMVVFATTGGAADASTAASVKAPEKTPFRSPRMQVIVGPSVERTLLDIVLVPRPFSQREMSGFTAYTDSISSDLMASLGLQKLLKLGSKSEAPNGRSLDSKIRSAISSLTCAQNKDGGWSWSCVGKTSDRYASARAVWALSVARRAGYGVSDACYDRAKHYVASQVAETANSDFESRAVLLHALCEAGQSDFSLANRLNRERRSLSTPALLYLALAFTQMDRKQIAADLLALVDRRAGGDGETPGHRPTAPLACSQSTVEMRALHALVLQRVQPKAPQAKQLVDWLLAHRTGSRWSPDRATGPAALALCLWFSDSRFQGERYRLKVTVNDHPVKTLDMTGAAASQVIDVPTAFLVKGKQSVRFELEGRGRYTYQVALAGFVPADKLKSSTRAWKVKRSYSPAPLERDGRVIPRGFGNVQQVAKQFTNTLTQLPMGHRGLVDLEVRRFIAANQPDEQVEYLVVTELIPCGATVIEQSVRGAFERFEIEPGAIRFFIGGRQAVNAIHYEMYGYLPGEYRASPTVVQNVYNPQQMAVGEPKKLTVLPAGVPSNDSYRLTPMELLALGKLAFDQRDWQRAESLLTELMTDWRLALGAYRQTVEMLLDTELELKKPVQIVRYFEIVHEKWPTKQIPFAKVLRIGAAYQEMGEFERSYLVFRASVEGTFTRESGVAGVLASEGDFLHSIRVMQRLLREYPPEPYVASAHYALAQQVYAKANQATGDPKLRAAGVERVELVTAAWRMLEEFLTEYPLDPAVDQAAFSAANALLELKHFKQAAAACERYAEQFVDSDLRDDFWFMIGYSQFSLGQNADAEKVLRKVVANKRPGKGVGKPAERDNKWPAIYILGQIYHSVGQVTDAIREYRLVESRYPDAKKSIAYFLRKMVRLPEVTTVKPGGPVEVELAYRNVGSCDLKVYRIDLMKFALLHQSLAGISRINLAGIKPRQEVAIELGDGKDYRDRTKTLALDLKDEGAYLIVCRGGSRFASGLVLITPLDVEVHYDATSSEVRAVVKDATSDKYVYQAQVKVIGSGDGQIISGESDRRGLFVAQQVLGPPTVIAQAGASRFAFHRAVVTTSASQMGSPPVPIPASAAPMLAAAEQAVGQPGQVAGIIIAGPGSSRKEQRIAAVLDLPTTMVFRKTKLENIAKAIEQQYRITVRLDRRGLDDVGLNGSVPITFSAKGLSLRSALNAMLHELDLTYMIKDESLIITTPEEAEENLMTAIYPVSDLVRFRDSKGNEWADYDTLINTITSTVAPDSWDDVGGAGAIDAMRYQNTDVLILAQSREVHRHIASLLNKLRSVAGTKNADGKLPLREQPQWDGMGGVGMGGGMGGGMGMGGFGGGGMGRPTGAVMGSERQGQRGAANGGLLEGLQGTQRRLQGRQVDRLQRMYKRGKGGMGGAGVGAGGMF